MTAVPSTRFQVILTSWKANLIPINLLHGHSYSSLPPHPTICFLSPYIDLFWYFTKVGSLYVTLVTSFFHLAYIFEVQLCDSRDQHSIPFDAWIVFHCMCIRSSAGGHWVVFTSWLLSIYLNEYLRVNTCFSPFAHILRNRWVIW